MTESKERFHIGGERKRCIRMYVGAILFVSAYVAGSVVLAWALKNN